MPIPKLDLHGVSHEDAEGLVHEFINANWKMDQELHIITGHSMLMKNVVRKTLDYYDVEVVVGDPRNSGYIRVLT